MDGIKILLEYFLVFKEVFTKNDNKHSLKEVDKLINVLKSTESRSGKILYIDEYKSIEKFVSEIDVTDVLNSFLNKYNTTLEDYKENKNISSYVKDIITSCNKGIDSVLYDVILNVNRYNVFYMNNKTRSVDVQASLANDLSIKDEIKVELKDILIYLEVDIEEIDSKLLKDLNKFSDLITLHKMAIEMKSGAGFMHFMYDRISDKEVLLSILLHSNDSVINSVKEIFDKYNVNLNKVINSIPSIFIKEPINSKCRYQVLEGYNNFISNVKLIEENNLDFKCMTNYPVFFVKDSDGNRLVLDKFKSLGVNIKNIYQYVGNMAVISPKIVFDNIKLLNLYGIRLTDDNNNNGYTLLGMKDLNDRVDYLIENKLWKKSDTNSFDNMDLIRGLIIKDDYLMWKNNIKRVKLDSNSHEKKFRDEMFSEENLNKAFEKYPELRGVIQNLDNNYLNRENNYYDLDGIIISRLRFLKNVCNYQVKGSLNDVIIDSLNYNSNLNDELIGEVMKKLEMGGTSVKLS